MEAKRLQERILVVSELNETELLTTMARLGCGTLGLRVMSPAELAETALTRFGHFAEKAFLPRREESAVLAGLLRETETFASASCTDAEAAARTLDTVRSLLVGDNEGEQLRKGLLSGACPTNKVLCGIYERYMETLGEKSVDTVGLIRAACGAGTMREEILTVKEYPPDPLCRRLADSLSAGGKAREISLAELFGSGEKSGKKLRFLKGYGETGEVENILTELIASGESLDRAVIAVSDPALYARLFYDVTKEYDIPMTFGTGIPVTATRPGELLRLLRDWDGIFGIEALTALLDSPALDWNRLKEKLELPDVKGAKKQLLKTAGALRISFEAGENSARLAAARAAAETELREARGTRHEEEEQLRFDSLDWVERLARELERGYAGFLEEYALVRGREDAAARSQLSSALSVWEKNERELLWDAIPSLLQKTVCAELSRPGAVHLTSISAAPATLREKVCVCGLSSAEFPGTPTENYLLWDDDLERFAQGDKESLPSSERLVQRKSEELRTLVRLCEAAGFEVTLSYCAYSAAELQNRNPSSVLCELYEEEHPGQSAGDYFEKLPCSGYFDSNLSATRCLAREETAGEAKNAPLPIGIDPEGRSWSPTSIDRFFECPLRFYLQYIAKLPEPEEDDPYELIPAAEEGDLLHSLMENFEKSKTKRDSFRKRAGEKIDRYFALRPPMDPESAARKKDDFVRMAMTAYDEDPGRSCESSEEELSGILEGIPVHGYPDRIEADGDSYTVADYKTGRSVRHKENDVDSCLQALLYAALWEQRGHVVTECQFRYPRKSVTVPCAYDDAAREAVKAKLREFGAALSALKAEQPPDLGVFPARGKEKAYRYENRCRYCRYKIVCAGIVPTEEEKTNEN